MLFWDIRGFDIYVIGIGNNFIIFGLIIIISFIIILIIEMVIIVMYYLIIE